MKSSWETYKGKKIFYARYDHMTVEEVRTEVNAIKKYIIQNMDKSTLVLVDATGTLISPEVLTLFKEIASMAGVNQPASKTAILGMTGPRKVFLEIVSKFSKVKVVPFDHIQQAKDWLIS